MKDRKFVISILLLISLAPITLNLWKLIARDYTLLELLPHLTLDFSIAILFLFLSVTKPLEKPLIYWPLFLLFSFVYLSQNTPDSILSWIVTILVLSFFGFYVFPNGAVSAMPWVMVGLYISYFLVLRLMLFEMNYSEAKEVINRKNPKDTAKEFIHILTGYERNMLGREKYRYFLYKDSDFRKRLNKAVTLHDQIYPSLKSQKISYLEWTKANSIQVGTQIKISSVALTGLSTEKNDKDYQISCSAKVDSFNIELIQLEDKTYRILDFPEKISVTRIE